MGTKANHDPLTRAAIKYGSDKYGAHLYTPFYHKIFSHLREAPIKLLEIGIGGYNAERAGGLGLSMWAEYFPNAEITGLDLHGKRLNLIPRIKTYKGSQTDTKVLADIVEQRGPFDVVIDDGSHLVEHVKETFRFLYPLIKPDGIYVVEDTQTAFSENAGGRADGSETIFDIANVIQRTMHALDGYQDPNCDPLYKEMGSYTHAVTVTRNIVVFERGDNTYPGNTRGFDVEHPKVKSVMDGIKSEGDASRLAGSYITRIDMLRWSRRHQEAEDLAIEAADLFADNESAMNYLAFLMRKPIYAKAAAHINSKKKS